MKYNSCIHISCGSLLNELLPNKCPGRVSPLLSLGVFPDNCDTSLLPQNKNNNHVYPQRSSRVCKNMAQTAAEAQQKHMDVRRRRICKTYVKTRCISTALYGSLSFYIRTSFSLYIRLHTFTYVYMRLHTFTYVYIFFYIFLRVFTYVYILFTYADSLHTFTYVYIRLHTGNLLSENCLHTFTYVRKQQARQDGPQDGPKILQKYTFLPVLNFRAPTCGPKGACMAGTYPEWTPQTTQHRPPNDERGN